MTSSQKYYQEHREVALAYSARYRMEHPETTHRAVRDWQLKNPKAACRAARNWRLRNPELCRLWRRRYKMRRRQDPIFAMVDRTRRRISAALYYRKLDKTICLLGCTPREFKAHLESLFLPGMSWANRNLWHIDHKIPICSFDLTTLAGQQAAFNFANTQPLWAADNLRKGAR